MSVLTKHQINTGCLLSSADFSALNTVVEGESTYSPLNPPIVEIFSTPGNVPASTQLIYSYSYISWRMTNGYFEIVEETAESATASVTTGGSTAQIRVWFDPPPSGYANGILIYRADGVSDTRKVAGIVLDMTAENFIDNTATGSRGKQSITKNTFQIGQSVIGSINLGCPFSPLTYTSSLISYKLFSGSTYTFLTNQGDFLLFSLTNATEVVNAHQSSGFEVQTVKTGYKVYIHETERGWETSRFVHPVPIPVDEQGLSFTNIGGSTTYVNIVGAYTGARRAAGTGFGTFQAFVAQVQGPYTSPSYSWSVPYGSRAIITYATAGGTNSAGSVLKQPIFDERCQLVLLADTITKNTNSDNTYSGSAWRLPPARISSPTTVFGGGQYGSWPRGHINPFLQPLVLNQMESITTVGNYPATIYGYLFND